MTNNNQDENLDIDNQKTNQHLVFTIGEGIFGIDIMIVREIKGWSEPTPIPNSPEHLLGVMNLRGIIIPIFDLHMLLTKNEDERKEISSKNVIIVLNVKEKMVGVLVDSVSDILTSAEKDVQPLESEEKNDFERNIDGLLNVENKMLVLLNIENLLSENMKNHEKLINEDKNV